MSTKELLRKLKIIVKKRCPLYVAKHNYYSTMHRWPDLKHPKDFYEKIIYMLYYTDHSMWTRLADKYRVREYLSAHGYDDILVPLYGHWENVEDIDFDSLPDSFVIKTNNGSGAVILVDDKRKTDISKLKAQLEVFMNEPYWCYSGEVHYRGIKPMIVAEKLLKDHSQPSDIVIDYKFFCFNGSPEFCMVCLNRTIVTHERDNAFYDSSWHRCDEGLAAPGLKLYEGEVPPPQNLDRMLTICRDLGAQFPFVRIDFYEVEGKLYFGEFTFTPTGFKCNTLHRDVMERLGSMIKLP